VIVIGGDEELLHYGVPGMKWGVRKASYKLNANKRLKKKALELDAKSAKLYKKSEKAHASYDLERSNKAATKAANYAKKSVKAQKKANKETNGLAKTMYERKAAKMTYKSEKAKLDANRLSRSTGYGGKAMKLAVKSDKAAIKAAKVRMKLAKNEAYVAKMKQRIDEVSKTDVEAGREYMRRLRNEVN
jgi:hypothetical protein